MILLETKLLKNVIYNCVGRLSTDSFTYTPAGFLPEGVVFYLHNT